MDTYTLKFKGLPLGVHHFEYAVDDGFWARFEGSEVSRGEVRVEVAVNKQPSMLMLDFEMAGEVEVACDRCLGEFRMPVACQGVLPVKFADDPPPDDGDVLWLHPAETQVDLTQYIYESIVLSLPFQRVHPDPADCDLEVVKYIKESNDNDSENVK